MLEIAAGVTKLKAFLAAFFILAGMGGVYEMQGAQDVNIPAITDDPYISDLKERAEIVNNSVTTVIDEKDKQPAWKYQATCESAVTLIKKDRLKAEQEYPKLTNEQKTGNEAYRAYLTECLNVVISCYEGKTPDITKINELKNKLS